MQIAKKSDGCCKITEHQRCALSSLEDVIWLEIVLDSVVTTLASTDLKPVLLFPTLPGSVRSSYWFHQNKLVHTSAEHPLLPSRCDVIWWRSLKLLQKTLMKSSSCSKNSKRKIERRPFAYYLLSFRKNFVEWIERKQLVKSLKRKMSTFEFIFSEK